MLLANNDAVARIEFFRAYVENFVILPRKPSSRSRFSQNSFCSIEVASFAIVQSSTYVAHADDCEFLKTHNSMPVECSECSWFQTFRENCVGTRNPLKTAGMASIVWKYIYVYTRMLPRYSARSDGEGKRLTKRVSFVEPIKSKFSYRFEKKKKNNFAAPSSSDGVRRGRFTKEICVVYGHKRVANTRLHRSHLPSLSGCRDASFVVRTLRYNGDVTSTLTRFVSTQLHVFATYRAFLYVIEI